MGDISEMRALVVIATFITVTIFLMGTMPAAFFTASATRNIDIPDKWESVDLTIYKDSWNKTITAEFENDFDVGGRNLRFQAVYADNYIRLVHLYGFGLLWKEGGTWFNRQEVQVSQEGFAGHQEIQAVDLDDDYKRFGDMEFTVTWEIGNFEVEVYFAFDSTEYDFPSDAWEESQLKGLIGITWDNVSTSYNTWDLMARMLFFQLPEMPLIMNVIIAGPIWAAVAYLAYIFILRCIGAVFGGGGA